MSPNPATPATPRLVAVRGWSRPRSGSDGRLLRAKALTDRAEHKLEAAVLLVGGGFRDSPEVMSDDAAPIRPAAAAAFHF